MRFLFARRVARENTELRMTKKDRSILNGLLFALVLGSAALIDARASAQETPPAPTRDQCDAAYTACFSESGFAGFFICPGQYGQCLAQVEEVAQTTSKLTACREAADTCRTGAGEDQEKIAACSTTQRECVTSALGIDTEATQAASACFTSYQQCAQKAENADAYAACTSALRTCLTPQRAPNPG